jgi:hypothetical protein
MMNQIRIRLSLGFPVEYEESHHQLPVKTRGETLKVFFAVASPALLPVQRKLRLVGRWYQGRSQGSERSEFSSVLSLRTDYGPLAGNAETEYRATLGVMEKAKNVTLEILVTRTPCRRPDKKANVEKERRCHV